MLEQCENISLLLCAELDSHHLQDTRKVVK